MILGCLSRSTQPNARCPESPDLSMVCEHVKNIAAEAAPTAARRSAAVAPPQRAGTRCFWRGVSFSRVTLSSTSTAPQERREQPEGRRAGCPESRNATRSHGCVRKRMDAGCSSRERRHHDETAPSLRNPPLRQAQDAALKGRTSNLRTAATSMQPAPTAQNAAMRPRQSGSRPSASGSPRAGRA